MPTIKLNAEVSTEELLHAVEQLPTDEFTFFLLRVLTLRAQRQSPCLNETESKLLHQINQGLPEQIHGRYNELIRKRQDQTLTPEEHHELLRLTEQAEMLEASRAQALVQLAQVRQKPLSAVLSELGIPAPADG